MYEQQLTKLSCPVQFRKEDVFVPSYHEKYPLIIYLHRFSLVSLTTFPLFCIHSRVYSLGF